MSCDGCVYYGYGLCTSLLRIDSVERLEKLLELAPQYRKYIHEEFNEKGLLNPEVDDYLDTNNQEKDYGYATLLANALEEITGMSFRDCENYEGNTYLLFEPKYPWMMSDNETHVAKEMLDEIFTKYISIVTDSELKIDYLVVEDC